MARKRAVAEPVFDGFVHLDFLSAATAMREQVRGRPGGAAVCVYRRGRCVADLWAAVRDAAGTPWTADTISPSFSTTKGVASTLLHMMTDRGLVNYDDRVAKHWPEFAQAGKGSITVRHVLAHRSGLYRIRQMIDHADRMLDWKQMNRAIERTPPAHEPGTRTGKNRPHVRIPCRKDKDRKSNTSSASIPWPMYSVANVRSPEFCSRRDGIWNSPSSI